MNKCMVPIDQIDAIDVLYRLEVATHDGLWAEFAVLVPLLVRHRKAARSEFSRKFQTMKISVARATPPPLD